MGGDVGEHAEETCAILLNLQSARNPSLSHPACLLIIVQPLQLAVQSETLNPGYLVTPETRLVIKDKGKICNMKCSRSGAPCFQPQCCMYVTSTTYTEGFSTPDMKFPKSITTTIDKCVTRELLKVSKERVLVADAQR